MGATISLKCPTCLCIFDKQMTAYRRSNKRGYNHFCSRECGFKNHTSEGTSKVICRNCDNVFTKHNSEILKSTNNFCSKSCAATYNNKNKSYGIRRSKLEIHIENKIKSEFPHISFVSNCKKIIGSELDLYFPSLNLAIEINGPLHYEPIYGEEKLLQIQANDKLKINACSDANIKLVTVDNLQTFSKTYSNKCWKTIKPYLIGDL